MNTKDHVKNERNNPNIEGAVSVKKEELEQAINLDYKLMVLEANTSIEGNTHEELPDIMDTFKCRVSHLLEFRKMTKNSEIRDSFFSRF